jgi:hypothetical protein
MHLRQAMALAASLGPEGEEMSRRAEAAIVAAGGAIDVPGDDTRSPWYRDR